MFVWDGSDREEGDVQAEYQDQLRRQEFMHNPRTFAQLQDYVAGFGLALAGARASEMLAPAPILTGGFTPNDEDRAIMCWTAERNNRDIIHINFRTIHPYTPTGLLTTIFLEGNKAHAHSRTSLLAASDDHRAYLVGNHDDTDESYSFRIQQGVKMTRHAGFCRDFTDDNLRRPVTMIESMINNGLVGDTGLQLPAFCLYPPYMFDDW